METDTSETMSTHSEKSMGGEDFENLKMVDDGNWEHEAYELDEGYEEESRYRDNLEEAEFS